MFFTSWLSPQEARKSVVYDYYWRNPVKAAVTGFVTGVALDGAAQVKQKSLQSNVVSQIAETVRKMTRGKTQSPEMNTKISEALSDALLETRRDNRGNLGENLTLKILEKANIPITQGDLSKAEWDDLTKTVAEFAKPTENKIETDKPQGYNEVTDTAAEAQEFAKYQDLLGRNAPETLEKFTSLKHNAHEWKKFKSYAKAIEKGELTPLADFELYNEIDSEIDDKLVGQTTSNGIKITGKTDHFISRNIGSVEERRSGVLVNNILDLVMSGDAEILGIRDGTDGRSQKFRFGNVEISINPDTGRLIQANPYKGVKKK